MTTPLTKAIAGLFFSLMMAMTLLAPSTLRADDAGLLVLRETGTISPSERESMKALFQMELEKYGIRIITTVQGANIMDAASRVPGVERLFGLDVIRLGSKLVLRLGEYAADTGDPIFSDSITSAGIEELDMLVPRVVKSVLLRKKIVETQTVENLTEKEGRAWKKKHGEFYWGLGLPFGWTLNPGSGMGYGFNLKAIYEMDYLRVDFYLGGVAGGGNESDMGIFATDLSVNWLFSLTNFSPYAGAGVGFGSVFVRSDGFDAAEGGPILTLNGGVEMFRLYSTRLIVGVRGVLPLFRNADGSDERWVPGLLTEVSFVW